MASVPTNPTQLTPPRVPLIDERTGAISREWYRFFLSLLTATQDNNDVSASAPDTSSLLASYDAMLADLAMAALASPSAETAELTQQVNALSLATAIEPRAELGTVSSLQQDYIPWFTFNTVPSNVPPTVGTLYWDGGQTLNIQQTLNVAGKVNEDNYYYIKATGAISKGQLVMVTGSVGASGVLTGAPATGLGINDGVRLVGVAAENIALNGFGMVQWSGTLRGFNTTGSPYGETWADGDILYYNPAYAGGLTKNEPVAPNVRAVIAAVVNAGSGGSGSIAIRLSVGSVLGGTDSNVYINGLTGGDILQYDGTDQRWENHAPSTITVGTATNLAGGAANRIAYQTGAGATSFIAAPTVANTFLEWSGSAFQWSANPLGTVTSVDVSGGTTGLSFSGGPITTSGTITMAGTLGVANGGTGVTGAPTNGQLLIGNGAGYTLAALTAGTGISVTNGAGSITVTNTAPDQIVSLTGAGTTSISGTYPNFTITSNDAFVGTVTSVSGTGTVNGITLTGTVTSSGSLTLGGTLSGVSLTSQVTGTLPVANGGTGATTFSSGYLLKGNGTSAVTASIIYDSGSQIGINVSSPSSGYTGSTGNSVTLKNMSSIIWQNSSASWNTTTEGGAITYWSDNNLYIDAKDSASNLIFRVNGATERARINSNGHFLINETSASAASLQHNFEVNGDIMSNGSAAGLFWANRSTTPTSGADWYGWYTTSGVIYLYNPAAGNIASINASTGAYTALSDAAKKKDFEPSTVGLDAVLRLEPTMYRMATDDEGAPKQLGFVAQQVKEHIPQAYVEEQNTDATGNEATYIGLNDRPIIAALVKAVQELEARVAALGG